MAININIWGEPVKINYGYRTTKSIQDVYTPNAGGDPTESFYSYKIKYLPQFIYAKLNISTINIEPIAIWTPTKNSFVLTTYDPWNGFYCYYDSNKGTTLNAIQCWKPDSNWSSANNVGIITSTNRSGILYVIVVGVYTTTSGRPDVAVYDWDTYIASHQDKKICFIGMVGYYSSNFPTSQRNNGTLYPLPTITHNCSCNYNGKTYYGYPSQSTHYNKGYPGLPHSVLNIAFFYGDRIQAPIFSDGVFSGKTGNDYILTYPELGEYYLDYYYSGYQLQCCMVALKHAPTTDQILRIACQFGFYVTTSFNNVATKPLNDSTVYLGIFNDDGVYQDKYTKGTGNNENPLFDKEYDSNDINIDWEDPNDYTNKVDLNTPKISSVGAFNRVYAINQSSLSQFADWLWNADETVFDQIIKGLGLMGDNPIESIISCRLYPLDISSLEGGGAAQAIKLGRTESPITGVPIHGKQALVDLGSCTFHRHFKNFLDYEPFTSASLYIPYCGVVPIPTAEFVGKTISVKLIVDVTTGACTTVVFADSIPYLYKNGTIGVDVPMSATNSADYASRILGGVISGTVDTVSGATTGNIAQTANSAMGLLNTALSINNANIQTAGSSSPSCGFWQPQNCYFIIRRPIVNMPQDYGHNIGFACNYKAKLSECKGYTQTYNVDVSTINAPEEEKNEIAKILNTGFFA